MMGIVSSTQLVPSGGVVVAESVQPCHLVGDPDLFDIGIRASFYLQYFTVGFILLYSRWLEYKDRPDDGPRLKRLKGDSHSLRISLTVLGLALFLALCINSTGDSLVILDWTIVSLLVLMGTLIVGVPLLESVVVLFYPKTKEAVAEIQDYRAEKDYGDVVLQNLAARRRHADNLTRNYYLASCISRNAARRNALLREARDGRIRMAVKSWNEYNATFQERDRHPGRVERDESDRIRNELWLNEFDLSALQDQPRKERLRPTPKTPAPSRRRFQRGRTLRGRTQPLASRGRLELPGIIRRLLMMRRGQTEGDGTQPVTGTAQVPNVAHDDQGKAIMLKSERDQIKFS